MADQVVAEAGWAVWSKHPGTREDYSVLACSDTFSKADFAKIISRYTAGTPDTRLAGGPGVLPWVTVSWVGVDDALRLGLAITDQADLVDGVGRPITRTHYFCVPYDQLERDAVSYSALYRAARQVTSFPEGGRPVPLTIPRLTAADMLASVLDDNKIDERVVGTAAALLLDGPVSVIQAEGSTVTDRLAFIDAVASLMPYGFRAKLTAGTWADSGVRHRLRLAFAARPKDDAATVSWRHGGEVPAGEGAGRRYFDHFRQLTAGGDADQVFSALAVADIMAKRTGPQRFEQPDAAAETLREIDLPGRVRRAIRDKVPVDLTELRRVFELGRLAELDPPRADLLTELSKTGEARDWPLAVGNLGELDGDEHALALVLAYFGTRMLWNGRPAEDVVRECFKIATERGLADNTLANLVETMPVPTAGHDAGIRIAVDLVRGTVLDGDRSAYLYTARHLAANPVAAAEITAALAAAGSAADLLGWLAPGLPDPLVRVFEFALRNKRGKPAEGDFAALGRLGDDCVRAALRAAFTTERLDSLLPGFTAWLAGRGPAGKDGRRYWQEALAGLSRSAQQRAYLDTALLSIGAAPTALPPPASHPDQPEYVDQLVSVWKQLAAASDRFSREDCVLALARYLDGQPWTASKQQAFGVAELYRRIAAYDREHALIGTLASGFDATPAARNWEFAQQLLEWVRKHDPDAVRNGLLVTFESLPAGIGSEKATELCLRAAGQNIKPEAALSALARSGALDSPAAVAYLLMDLRADFDKAEVDPRATAEWLRALVDAVAQGEFSSQRADFTREVRDLVSRYTRDEMWQQFLLLSALTKSLKDGQYDLPDEERASLTDLAEAIDGFLRKAAKRSPLWKSVLPGARSDEDARPGLWSSVDREGR
jgi:hypothetical protein